MARLFSSKIGTIKFSITFDNYSIIQNRVEKRLITFCKEPTKQIIAINEQIIAISEQIIAISEQIIAISEQIIAFYELIIVFYEQIVVFQEQSFFL